MPSPSNPVVGVRLNDGPQELTTRDAHSASIGILQEFHPKLTFSVLEQLRERGLRLFGTVQDRKLLGVATVTTQLHLSEGERPWIEDLLVHPDHRGQGHGQELFRHVVDALHNEGFAQVLVRTRQGNQGAINFYLNNGCVVSGPAFKCE